MTLADYAATDPYAAAALGIKNFFSGLSLTGNISESAKAQVLADSEAGIRKAYGGTVPPAFVDQKVAAAKNEINRFLDKTSQNTTSGFKLFGSDTTIGSLPWGWILAGVAIIVVLPFSLGLFFRAKG